MEWADVMSAKCQEETHASQQTLRYSIISSAADEKAIGTLMPNALVLLSQKVAVG